MEKNFNATQAYLAAYGGEYDTAKSRACKLMKKPEIKAYVKELQKDAFEAACINAERIAAKLAELAFVERGDDLYGSGTQTKALDLLQKQLSLQNQNIKADVDNKITISIGIKEEETEEESDD